ncbi:MAG TPA: GAF domain-containing protein [Candidatus Sulfotelmatobacter sp.]|nr:GAF domain-containing protein [Candidatus Sulfotelmatobacter sp.]
MANAVAVQKSGLHPSSLSAVVETQQFIASDEFALDRAMQMVADCILRLLNASGTAIACLDSNELVYRAAAGSATKDLGRRIAAVLNISPCNDVRREILRVENAATDMRIEAEVCRQFGAISLLMLPICETDVLLGVLEVRFDNAHSFTHQQIRVCRLLIGVLEEGIVRHGSRNEVHGREIAVQQARHQRIDLNRELHFGEVAAPLTVLIADTLEQNTSNGKNPPTKVERSLGAVIRAIDCFWKKSNWEMSSSAISNANSRCMLVALSAIALLAIITWLVNAAHNSPSTNGLSVAKRPETVQLTPTKRLPENDEHHERTKSSQGFRRAQISPNEVDYFANDVTIKYFTSSRKKPQPRSGVKEVNFGDDVTVRYFADAAPATSQPPSRLQSETSAKGGVFSDR